MAVWQSGSFLQKSGGDVVGRGLDFGDGEDPIGGFHIVVATVQLQLHLEMEGLQAQHTVIYPAAAVGIIIVYSVLVAAVVDKARVARLLGVELVFYLFLGLRLVGSTTSSTRLQKARSRNFPSSSKQTFRVLSKQFASPLKKSPTKKSA